MNNYEYIVAGLPVLQKTFSPSGKTDADGLIAGIREQLSDKDNAIVDFLLKGYDPEALDHSFYVRALAHKNRFIRSYFEFDLKFRNVRVEYLNKSLGLPERKDTIVIHEEHGDFDEKAELLGVLSGNDILKRERGLDDIVWKKVDELTIMDVFDIEAILAFIVKLKIIDRWEKLDPATGRELFRKLVDEIRSTYDNKKNNII